MCALLLGLLLCLVASSPASSEETRLLRRPTVSRDQVAFEYAGDLWSVSRNGGQARRLTSTPEPETDPHFSPDGSRIAFTSTVHGNTDVYVVSASGGESQRLTYHPGVDCVRGWSPDGRRVVFASSRGTLPTPGANSFFRLWTIGLEGGLPEPLPMPRAFAGTFSPDGRRMAYEEVAVAMFAAQWAQNQSSQWRHYRGGRTHPVRLMNLADYSVEKLPWTNSNDTEPMWIGTAVYFLSDRSFTTNLFVYRTDTKQLTQLTHHDDFDIMSASAGPDAVVYEQAGYIHLVDAATGNAKRLSIEVQGDLPWARPHFRKITGAIRNAALSPSGARAAFEARGEIVTVPAEKGDYRNLTLSPGAHDRSPVWSPDGSQLAWLSDASGEYGLMLGDATGATKPRSIALPSTAFFSAPVWSPDGKHLLLEDNHLNLWSIDLNGGAPAKIDVDTYDDPGRRFDATWSPDSQWIAYSKSLDSHLRAIFVYSVADRKAHQVTDGLSDATSPAFDGGGKYLYFLASTNYALRTGWLEMSSVDRPVTRAIYLVVLSANEPSPLLPETGDEPVATARADTRPAAPVGVRIDFDRIGQRILALNVPAADYSVLAAGAPGTIFYMEPARPAGTGPAPPLNLQRYQLKERKAAPFLEGIRSYTLSADSKKLLYQAPGNRWGIVPTDRPAPVRGENWNPDLQAPLSAPGVQVAEGDYLLEVNGRALVPPTNLYQLFEGTAGHQTLIRVNSTPSSEGSRLVTVVPVASEESLRTRAWIESNRRLVEKTSKGRLAYVWLPNTSMPGYAAFNRYYYAQQDKDGVVIDERYNQGGMVADYIVNELDRKQMGYFARRDGKPSASPAAGIYGPKVMIINESAGSGGDALPYYFKLRKIGPLIGTRTWGGMVGTLGIPATIDGGGITAPSLAFYDLSGRWALENEGVAPDIEVENTPAAVIAGHDPQLERAIDEALKLLDKTPAQRVPRPAPLSRVSMKPKS